jgi:hypothetical protein
VRRITIPIPLAAGSLGNAAGLPRYLRVLESRSPSNLLLSNVVPVLSEGVEIAKVPRRARIRAAALLGPLTQTGDCSRIENQHEGQPTWRVGRRASRCATAAARVR